MKNTKLFFHLFLACVLTLFLNNTSQAQLKAGEGVTAKAFIGVNYHHVSNHTAEEKGYPNKYGSYVVSTIEGTNAKSSGILQGDYITGINENYAKQNFTITDILRKYCPGDRVTLHIMRGEKQKKDVEITLVDYKLSKHMIDNPFLGVNYGVLNGVEEQQGAAIGEIVPHSSAEEMGMQKNDIIKEINGVTLEHWGDLHDILDNIKVGQEVNIVYDRAGQTLEGTTFIKNRANTYYHNCNPVAQEEAKVETEEEEEVVVDVDPNTIKLYPNPTDGLVTVAFKMPEEGKVALRILDNRGQIMYTEEIKKQRGSNFYEKEFNLANYPKGMYFLQVMAGELDYFTKKIILK